MQVYSLLVYRGPGAVPGIKSELAASLKADGFLSVADAVGADHRVADASNEKEVDETGKRSKLRGTLWGSWRKSDR